MRKEEQIDALEAELNKVIHRFKREFDICGPEVVCVLEQIKREHVDVNLDFEADLGDADEPV